MHTGHGTLSSSAWPDSPRPTVVKITSLQPVQLRRPPPCARHDHVNKSTCTRVMDAPVRTHTHTKKSRTRRSACTRHSCCPISLAHNNTADPSASNGRVREKTPRTTVLNKGGRWRTGRLRWLGPIAAPVLRRELSLAPHGAVKATTTGRRFGLSSRKRRQGADSGYPKRHVACQCPGAYTLTLANPAATPRPSHAVGEARGGPHRARACGGAGKTTPHSKPRSRPPSPSLPGPCPVGSGFTHTR